MFVGGPSVSVCLRLCLLSELMRALLIVPGPPPALCLLILSLSDERNALKMRGTLKTMDIILNRVQSELNTSLARCDPDINSFKMDRDVNHCVIESSARPRQYVSIWSCLSTLCWKGGQMTNDISTPSLREGEVDTHSSNAAALQQVKGRTFNLSDGRLCHFTQMPFHSDA